MTGVWDRAAMRFASAEYVARHGMLDVTFENGDHFLVAAESLLPAVTAGLAQRPGPRVANPNGPPDWARMRIGETGDVLKVPAADTVIEIPWDRIRSVADPAFRAHLAEQALQRARRIGARIQAMRREAGLTRGELAEKVGVPREVIADLEAGRAEAEAQLIQYIAVALGKRLRDFAEE